MFYMFVTLRYLDKIISRHFYLLEPDSYIEKRFLMKRLQTEDVEFVVGRFVSKTNRFLNIGT